MPLNEARDHDHLGLDGAHAIFEVGQGGLERHAPVDLLDRYPDLARQRLGQLLAKKLEALKQAVAGLECSGQEQDRLRELIVHAPDAIPGDHLESPVGNDRADQKARDAGQG